MPLVCLSGTMPGKSVYHCFTLAVNKSLETQAPTQRSPISSRAPNGSQGKTAGKAYKYRVPAVFFGFRAFAAGVLPFRNRYIWVYFGVNVLPLVKPHLKSGVKQN